jgi:bacterioferritin-associated ferredoxin
MYLCICNALRQSQLAETAAQEGVETPACVFKAHGTKPQCGRCLPDIAELIDSVPRREDVAFAAE